MGWSGCHISNLECFLICVEIKVCDIGFPSRLTNEVLIKASHEGSDQTLVREAGGSASEE